MIVPVDQNETRGLNYRDLLLNTVRSPSIESSAPIFFSTLAFSPLWVLTNTPVSILSFRAFEISCPYGLIYLLSYHSSQFLIIWRHAIPTQFLGCTLQILSEPCNLFLYTNHRGTFHQRHLTCSQLDLIPSCIATLDAIILKGNTERIRQASCCIISFGRLTMAVYQKSKLSPSQESVVLMSSLLFNSDSPSGRGTGDDLSRRRDNPRIKHLKTRKDCPLIDCDVIKSSADSPALKVIWVLEFSETQCRDCVPRGFIQFENKFLQHDAHNSRHQDSWKIEESEMLNSAVLVSILLHVSWQFLVRTENFLSWAWGFSKTLPDVPIEFRVWCGNPESLLSISGARNSRWLTGKNVRHSRSARCLQIVKKTFSSLKAFTMSCRVRIWGQELIHRWRFFFPLIQQYTGSQLSSSFRIFTRKFLNLHAFLCMILLIKSTFRLQLFEHSSAFQLICMM